MVPYAMKGLVFERESARPAEPHPEGSATKLSDDAALVWTSDFARAWLIMHAPRSQPSAVMREISNAVNTPDQPASSARSGCGEGEAMSEAMMGEAGEDDMGDSVPDDQLGETMPMTGSEEPGDPGTPWRPENDLSNIPKEPFYKAYTEQFDEVVPAETLCDAEELGRLRQLLDQQLVSLQGLIGKLANRLQRRLMAQQMRSWEFNLEEGLLET